jgi:hypothetical protein
MKLGMLHLFENPVGKTEHEVIKEQMELMYEAETLGFDSIWVSAAAISLANTPGSVSPTSRANRAPCSTRRSTSCASAGPRSA